VTTRLQIIKAMNLLAKAQSEALVLGDDAIDADFEDLLNALDRALVQEADNEEANRIESEPDEVDDLDELVKEYPEDEDL